MFGCAFKAIDVAGNLRRANTILVIYLVNTNRRTHTSSMSPHAFYSVMLTHEVLFAAL
jgi:hypothetical protein